MRTALVSPRHNRLHFRADAVRSHSRNAIQIFSQAKLVEHKLASKTGTFIPEIQGNQSTIRKTLVRLKTMFARAIEKQKPYVEYAEKPLLEIVDRQKFVLTVVSRPQMLNTSYRNLVSWNSTERAEHFRQVHFTRLVSRYRQYLQFLCLKYALPFELDVHLDVQLTPQQARVITELTQAAGQALTAVEVQYTAKIGVNIVAWRNRIYNNHLEGNPSAFETVDDFLADALSRGSESVVFSPTNWQSCTLTTHMFPRLEPKRYKRYAVPEKLFFYIPQILQVLNSLTRQTNYVSSAFSIGAVEGS